MAVDGPAVRSGRNHPISAAWAFVETIIVADCPDRLRTRPGNEQGRRNLASWGPSSAQHFIEFREGGTLSVF